MNKRLFILVVSFILVFSVFFSGQAKAAQVTVLGFENEGISWTSDQQFERELLRGTTRKFTERLHEVGDFDVIDYSKVNDVLTQTGYQYGQQIEPTMIPHLSRTLETNLLIIGNVDKIAVSDAGKVSVGPISVSSINSEVELSARLINTRTGNILATFSSSGEETESGIEIDDLEGLSFGSEDFTDSAVGKAINKAVNELADNVTAESDLIETEYIPGEEEAEPEEVVIEGEIVDTIGGSLVLNIGEEDGLSEEIKGDIIRVIDSGDDDPLTVSYGEVQVSSVDTETSIVKVVEAEEDPQLDDFIKFELTDSSEERAVSDTGTTVGVIEKIETEDFIVYIERAIRSRDEVTVSGTVEAKNEAEFSLYIPKGFEIYDHTGGTVQIRRCGTKVQLGNSTSSGSSTGLIINTASVTENILPGYPQMISWTFNQVPEDADHLARLRLYFETESVGEIEINLDGIEWTSY